MIIILLLLFMMAPPLFAEEPASQPQLPEVVIKGGEKSGIEGEKPPLQIDFDSTEPVQPILEVEEDLLRRQPEMIRSARIGFVEHMHNTRIISPARAQLIKEPVKIFYPLKEISNPADPSQVGKGWEIIISDGEGQPFRKFSGKGLPPSTLPWDGRGMQGEMMEVGKNYSMVISYKDNHRLPRNFIGKPFSLDGIIHQEATGLAISLAANALFQPKNDFPEREKLAEKGMSLLEEAADWIKRYYFTHPLRIESITKDRNTAQSQADEIAHALGSLLRRPTNEIAVQTFPNSLEADRIDIIITNR